VPENQEPNSLPNEIKRLETKYKWMESAKHCRSLSDAATKSGDFLRAAELWDHAGLCYNRAAMQADDSEKFLNIMSLAVQALEKAADLFENRGEMAKAYGCRAKMRYLDSLIVSEPATRKNLLEESVRLYETALKMYEDIGDREGYGKTCNETSACLLDKFEVAWEPHERETIVRKAVDLGEEAIKIWSQRGNNYELTRAHYLKSLHYWGGVQWTAFEETPEEAGKICLAHAQKALELSTKLGDSYLISMCNFAIGVGHFTFTNDLGLSLKYLQEALQQGRVTNDNYLIGVSLCAIAAVTNWMMDLEEDPHKKKEGYETSIQFSKEAAKHLCKILQRYWLAQTYQWHVESYSSLASDVETAPEEKHALLKTAIEGGLKSLEYAQQSGSPTVIDLSLHALSKALYFASTMETNFDTKRKMLERALKHREREIDIAKRVFPFDYWGQGVIENYLALIRAELAKLELDEENKKGLLVKAVLSMENCIELCKKWTKIHPQTRYFVSLGQYHDRFAKVLNQLYALTKEKKIQLKAIEIYEGAIRAYGKTDLHTRLAEVYWEIAKLSDETEEYSNSAANFASASEKYMQAAKRLEPLKEFYTSYALYMRAWSEIERAKHCHVREDYSGAKQNYQKAGIMLKQSKIWGYLAQNFEAWVDLERGEDLSRREREKEAIQAFQQASKLFDQAKLSLTSALQRVETAAEKEKAIELCQASELRSQYCQGRVCLEEARIYAKEGNYILSAERYSSAATVFQAICEALVSEAERKELLPIISLCKAWHKMMIAQEKVSPELYNTASELFDEAKEFSLSERTSLLALANSCLCKALAAGIRFEVAMDSTLYSTAKRFMESAANYYLTAGFEKDSIHVSANEALFDGFVYMSNAEMEIDHDKKKQLYGLAEKYFSRAAELYEKAGYIRKKTQVLRLLEKVKDKRKFAFSSSQMLEAPEVASSTSLMLTPTPAHEKAVGLEKFEDANVQAYLAVPEDVTVGEELEVRLDFVNVGKNYGLIVRIDELVPKGLKVTKAPPNLSLEDGSIEMKGKKLEPLKVESFKFSAEAIEAGVLDLSPKITYVDELGRFQVRKLESVRVTVHPPHAFQFKIEAAEKVFSYLIEAFIQDYMKAKFYVEKSGWRSLVQIIKDSGVAKTSVYGERGTLGPALVELERRGLIESRFFSGERGRGGKVLRVRISYEKETIKRYVDQHVMKIVQK